MIKLSYKNGLLLIVLSLLIFFLIILLYFNNLATNNAKKSANLLVTNQQTDSEKKVISDSKKVDELAKEAENILRLQDQNKAFGSLLFGDDAHTVARKLREDRSLKVEDTSLNDSGVIATFSINDDYIMLMPEFYEGKLYRVVLSGMSTTHAKIIFEAFINMVNEKYGKPDYVTDDGYVIWNCGKKTISVTRSVRAHCIIYDAEVVGRIGDKEKKEITEKSHYF